MPRPLDEWDELAQKIVDAIIENLDGVNEVAEILRKHHGVETPAEITPEEYKRILEWRRSGGAIVKG